MKILVCDDENLGRTVASVLAFMGHQVEVASDGREALDLIRAKPDFFNLLITDNRMPRLTGVELIEKLRASNFALKIIMMTGYATQIESEVKPLPRLDGFLSKPFKATELLECVKNLEG